MGDLLLILAGVAVGTYYAESIREKVPMLAPASTSV
jgi:hypothetical protein